MSVWYCEELDEIDLHYAHAGFVFYDKSGPFQLAYYLADPIKTYKFYWIGDFD